MTRGATLWLSLFVAAFVAATASIVDWSTLGAQEATPVASPAVSPVASPIAGSVPCTALFGIAEGQACLLTLNESPDSGPFDLYIDGSLAVSGVSFAALGEFIPVLAGERQFEIVPTGFTLADAVVATRGDLREGVAYAFSAYGPAGDLRVLILPIDTRPLAANTSRLRIVHGSPDVPAIELAITGGVPLIEGVSPGQASSAIDVPSGLYEMEARIAATSDVLLPLPGTVLLPDTTYSIYLSGSPAGGSLGVTLAPVFVAPDIAASATPVA